jgi:hypothetical protein
LIFSIVLTARIVGRGIARLRKRNGQVAAMSVIGAFLVCYAVEFGVQLTHAVPVRHTQPLTVFLEQHNLRDGIGDYWSSSLVTVDSGGDIRVRPVYAKTPKTIVRFDRQSSADWYGKQQFDFLVYDTARPWRGVNANSAAQAFGTATHTFRVGTYRILTWSRPIHIVATEPDYGNPVQIFFSLKSASSLNELMKS